MTLLLNGYYHTESNSVIAYYSVYSIDGERFLGYTDNPGTIEFNAGGVWVAPYPPPSRSDRPITIVTKD